MRKVWLGLMVVVLGVVAPVVPAGAATHAVSIVSVTAGFSPASITINAGDTVKWTNNDPTTTHTVTSTDSPAVFDSGDLAPGGVGTYSHTFNDPGSYPYHCSIHSNMTGSVFVQGASTTPAPTVPPAATTSTARGATTSSSVRSTTSTSRATTSSSSSTTSLDTSTSEASTTTTPLVAAGAAKHNGGSALPVVLVLLILAAVGAGGFAIYRLRATR